jgi:hypothetical protein
MSLPITRTVSIDIPQYTTITQNNANCMSNLIQDGIGLKRSIPDNIASRVPAPI